jgi:hypothetical protein
VLDSAILREERRRIQVLNHPITFPGIDPDIAAMLAKIQLAPLTSENGQNIAKSRATSFYGNTVSNSIFGSEISAGTKTLSARACIMLFHCGPVVDKLKYWQLRFIGTDAGI